MKDFFQYRESLTEGKGLTAADKRKIENWGETTTDDFDENILSYIKDARLTPDALNKGVTKFFKKYREKQYQQKLAAAKLNFKNPKKYPNGNVKWSGDEDLDRDIGYAIEDLLTSGQKEVARGEYGVYSIGKYFDFVRIEDEGGESGFVEKSDRLPRGKLNDAIREWEKWYTGE